MENGCTHIIILQKNCRFFKKLHQKMAKKDVKLLKGDASKEEKENLSLAKVEQPDNLCHADAESSLLIHQLGRDISLSCLVRCSRSYYGIIASLNTAFRSVIRSGELYRLRREMGFVEHWVYFSCNLLEWDAFDPIHNRWMHLPKMNISDHCFMCSDKESLAVGTELLVFGRGIMSYFIYSYSILTHAWTYGMTMETPRCLFGSASLGEIAIIAGGVDMHGNVLDSAELYNSETGEWMTIPSMNQARKMCSAVFMDGKFYVIGGIGFENFEKLTCGEEYDLKTKTWRVVPNMYPNEGGRGTGTPTAEAPPLVAVVKNELYAADPALKAVKKYDKEKNLWEILGPLPERAISMNGWGIAFKACGEQLIIIGGPRSFGNGMIEINSWVPTNGPIEWKLLVKKWSSTFVYNCAVMGC
ncbi:hypothetical protein like AT2G02870 [Hibiscus trionum]|uniref:F-box/kelch-repeat protein n=1 Tax=Hibiscus trionum TaxID=183268 RepID=A0A9W7J3I1_HIBTR|nr:hypothetical protein like AT2G02870 [Hibiscus trionum]